MPVKLTSFVQQSGRANEQTRIFKSQMEEQLVTIQVQLFFSLNQQIEDESINHFLKRYRMSNSYLLSLHDEKIIKILQ